MTMALIDGRIRREAIEIPVAVDVGDPDALGGMDDDIERMIIVRSEFFLERDKILCLHEIRMVMNEKCPDRKASSAAPSGR